MTKPGTGCPFSQRGTASSSTTISRPASAAMRRLVLLHGLVSFLFNAVIVGAAVNIAAGVVR